MRVQKRQLGSCALLLCAFGFTTAPSRADDDEINWLGNYSEAIRQARQSQKPILVEFRCEA